MTAVTQTTMGGGPSSPTGYEAFLKDSEETGPFDMAKIQEKSPPPPVVVVAEKAPETPEESWTASITTGAQSVVTNYFPPKSPCGDKALIPFSNCGEVPNLAASSSSEKSGLESTSSSTKGTLSDWAEKMSSTCNMETPCGKLDIEFMQKEEPKLPPQGNELTQQGEPLAIEGGPPPKPWTEELSTKVQEAQTTVSTKANGLFVALGLSIKKDQVLMTDIYNATSPKEGEAPKEVEPEEKPEEKSLSEKMQEVQTTVSQKAQSVSTTVTSTAQVLFDTGMSTLGNCTKEEENKEMKQTDPTQEATTVAEPTQEATTAADPSQESAPTEAAVPFPEIPAIVSITSIATEPIDVTPQEEETKSSPSWNLWEQFKGFMGKFKLPEKTPTCEVPKVELPPCTAPSEIEIPSCGVFSFIPQTFEKEATTTEEAKVEETKKAEEVKVEEFKEKTEELKVKIEETNKAEELKVVSPKESALPW
mmetsp:Transcript_27870/g.51325  ORF Transcript_27870/g.51325 Transcript_27870/m.51325 type:complete len:476 (+) Transcript_27870:103-1530(+)|eukprot:CAMPEP_0201892652 /NCGR_PEP_ID=MMETSP0902-20130614/36931_1 /ASSEMBLY_ACC=CAM_ASM_000551 /TAXON_ID=420261 /ORGANISM="Thalassiosira antarctica, Strain CCMP982" /LENGTH=475 /DNA_ID=CAMNT_0048424173 /DNA_START=20 /DNA_END=1447 /DNA_ORIENTATION=+